MKALIKILVLSIFIVSNANYALSSDEEKADVTLEKELRWLQAEAIVFTASRSEQKVSETPAAVFVITQEDIRRSGVTCIPEALRLVPGLQVARIDSNIWAISSRGFNDRFTNKLLVLIDGRTVYTPLFAGVYWDREDTLLEDIERIEVIRGPGAALWGANAVNGIINIITKNAEDTQGGLVVAGGGSEERGFGALRFGREIGNKGYCKGYIKYSDRDDFTSAAVEDTMDEWDILQGGFRLDRNITDRDSLTLQGDIYNTESGDLENVITPFSPFTDRKYVSRDADGRNILGRWNRTFSDTSDMSLQLYYDYAKLCTTFHDNDSFSPHIKTYDLDFQHHFQLNDAQEIIWGLGYRLVSDDIATSTNLSINPPSRDAALSSAFLQDEIILVKDRLKLILGSKLEDNDYSGFEIQPNGRLLWTPNERHTLWTSISRAVVTPSRAQSDMEFCYANPIELGGGAWSIAKLSGNRDFKSEELIAYELGYRVKPSNQLFLDIASFYNDYDKLQTYEVGDTATNTPPLFVTPVTLGNKMSGETYGIELSSQWLAKQWLRFNASYSYLKMNLRFASDHQDAPIPGSAEKALESVEKASPKNQFRVTSSMDLPWNMDLDTTLRYVDNLPAHNIDSYVEMDLRLGWKPRKNVEVSLMGQNLLDKHHPEFPGDLFGLPLTEVERGGYAKVRWEF